MRKKSLTLLVATTLASSVLFSSCIGSFGLTNKLLSWNSNIDSKFVNELVFIAFWMSLFMKFQRSLMYWC